MKKLSCLLICLPVYFSIFAQTEIKDTDGNTKVQTEKFANENIIRMDLNGSERLVLKRNTAGGTQMEFPNNGENLFLGNFSGALNTGTQNTFIGQGAGGANTSGNQNTFVGQGTGAVNSIGQENTFVGKVAGSQNTTGTFNTFIGESAGIFNTSGNLNTFLGESAGFSNTTASENTYVGAACGSTGTTAQFNAFMGAFSGQANTASSNTFVGHSAGRNNTSGGTNTFLGGNAGRVNTTGLGNTYLGRGAGDSHAANTNCTLVGNGADALLNGITNSTALGNGTIVNAHNKIRFGNTAVSVIEGQVYYSVSDGRFKTGVKQDAPGLDFIMGLRPVTYHFDYTGFSDFLGEEHVDNNILRQKELKREMGFIAQEVEELCAKQGIDLSNLVHTPENEQDNFAVAYGQIVVPLVKAIQEQQAEISELKAMVAQLLATQSQSLAGSGMDVQLWPNPASDMLQVAISGTNGQATLELLSANGAVVRSAVAEDGIRPIMMTDLPAGLYYVKISAPGKATVVKTVVKAAR